jgi:preprotein translocase subunit SecF
MEWFQFKREFQFVGHRRRAFIFSAVLLLVAVASIATQGLRFGIDFTGGFLIEVGFDESQSLDPVREALGDEGFEDFQVQHFGSSREILIRIAPTITEGEAEAGAGLSDDVLTVLRRSLDQAPEMRRVEFVGPQVGQELREQGGLAMLYALGMILIYVAFRFEKRFALGAVAALVHDVIVVLGVFSLTQVEFSLPVLAAILAVIGYSLNDTIVVFDRIRENFRRQRRGTPEEITNSSINQMIARTLVTSLTTLMVLISMLVFGGEAMFGFALALTIGVIVGTYSSIYVASTLLLAAGLSREDMMPVEKEGEDADERP